MISYILSSEVHEEHKTYHSHRKLSFPIRAKNITEILKSNRLSDVIEGSGNQIKLKSNSRGLSRLRLSASVNFKTSSYNEVISYKEKKKIKYKCN